MKRNSKPREAVLKTLKGLKTHPTAEEVYNLVKKEIPDISMGTVYRNLSEFIAEGQAVIALHDDGKQRFDGDVLPHAHFVCSECGGVYDFKISDFPLLTANAPGVAESVSLTVKGVCAGCVKDSGGS